MMSQPTPFWPQSVLHSPETLLDQWQETQERTLEYLGSLFNLGVQSYQDGWQLGTEWIREFSPSADVGDGPASLDNAMNAIERAQRLVIGQLDELDRLNREWWANVFAATEALSQQASTVRPKTSISRTIVGTARAA